jgi:GNAT superfamily N-acetyltransferase
VAVEIRPASAADEPAIAQIRRAAWIAAYAQIIDAAIIERVTAPDDGASAAPPPYRSTLVAVAPQSRIGGGADARMVAGYASFGPERTVAGAVSPGIGPAIDPGPLTSAGVAGETGELYALYVTPAQWSTGAGRALTDAVLAALRAAGYRRVVLWTLTANARARRFYAKAGFAPDGARNILGALGGVEELRYASDL